MEVGIGSFKLASDNDEGGSDLSPTYDVPLTALATTDDTTAKVVPVTNGTTIKECRTQFEGPHNDTP